QIWLPELKRADRCTTCHQAVSWKGFENAEEPLRTHPAEILKQHPVEKYGCTACHGGQPHAVDDKSALMQMNCNSCHRYDRETPGASEINLAKKIVREKGCRACHVINGRGGSIGPDLTNEGDKAAEQFEYGRLNGQHSAFAWHVAHLKDPRALVPETVMPNFHLSTREAQAIAMMVMSWKREKLPATYLAGAPRTDPQTKDEVEAEQRMKTGPGAWFVKTGCFVCHSISALGVTSPAQIGPDLSIAVDDVQSRFGRTLEDFLREPTGTMSVVLSRQIILSPEEKAVAVQKLHEAFAEYQKQKAAKALTPAAPAHEGAKP
ncbi:MAG TPA: c-type cytochrome, partial [Polyangia bacterium]